MIFINQINLTNHLLLHLPKTLRSRCNNDIVIPRFVLESLIIFVPINSRLNMPGD